MASARLYSISFRIRYGQKFPIKRSIGNREIGYERRIQIFNPSLGPPSVSPFGFPDQNRLGGKVNAFCTSNDQSSLSWMKDGRVIETGSSVKVTRLDGALRLVIEDLTSNHSGNYTCAARNSHGSSSYSAVLSVISPPKWTTVLEDRALARYGPVRLACEASGHPTPNITWSRNGGKL